MTNKNQTPTRDDVLFAFHEEFAKPNARQIIEWMKKFPQFADDIQAHAAVSLDWAARGDETQKEPSESSLASAYSRALSALYNAEIEADAAQDNGSTRSLREILAACGKDVPSLQIEIGGSVGIVRSVLADLFNGAMLPPLSNRLKNTIRGALSLTVGEFQAAHERTLASPRLGHANSTTTPTVNARSCEDIIRNSGMTFLQIKYWLDED
ncbi:MAG TPA: hypothetical protein VJQ48_10080 [Candidatus Binatia bacterium]|nr:hypothetical protein [Candidatus Binatia bacterium]